MRIILLGAPGAGKGTQADLLCRELHIPKISTGDMLRAAVAEETKVGQAIKQVMGSGQLIQDDIIIELIQERLRRPDCTEGCLFDGFPRTVSQATMLDEEGIGIDIVIEISVPDNEIIQRLSGRRIHVASGRTYHTIFNPPKVANRDDVTGEPLIQRADDIEETVKKRLELYHQETEPLVNWYQDKGGVRVVSIPGMGSIEGIHQQILTNVR